MNLPSVEQPDRFRGLYVYDFGEWTAVGYTAEEIAILLESEEYGHGKAYKIHRAGPDGSMELRGVAPERFRLESGMLFYRNTLEPARADFQALQEGAQQVQAPCRAFVHLAERPTTASRARFVTALVYPSEYEDEIGRWLIAVGFEGGDWVEGGASHVSDYYAEEKNIIERQQLWSQTAITSRPAEEVLANVRRAVQR